MAVSPREAMARQIAGLVSEGPVRERSPIARDVAEVWEVEIQKGTAITRHPLKDLGLTKCLIAAIQRDDHVRVAGGNDQLAAGDTAIILVHKEIEDSMMKMLVK